MASLTAHTERAASRHLHLQRRHVCPCLPAFLHHLSVLAVAHCPTGLDIELPPTKHSQTRWLADMKDRQSWVCVREMIGHCESANRKYGEAPTHWKGLRL